MTDKTKEDIMVLARRLRAVAFNEGQDDTRPFMSDTFYKKAVERTDKAMSAFESAIDSLIAQRGVPVRDICAVCGGTKLLLCVHCGK